MAHPQRVGSRPRSMADRSADGLAVSVIMPVRNGARFLPQSLAALKASNLNVAWELVVIDDGSGDASAAVAAELADRVVRLPSHLWGPAAARNYGAMASRAPILVFVDADVCVHPDALHRIHRTLGRRPEISAVFGAYDHSPTEPDLTSQYRNLLHTYVHHRDAGEVVTFWTGLGGIRREAFFGSGAFDEGQRIDDVELGYRLTALGHRILLDPAISGTHLKRWTLRNLVVTDVLERGVPWVRLLLRGRHRVGRATLSVRPAEWALTILAGAVIAAIAMSLITGDVHWLLAACGALGLMLAGDLPFLNWLGRRRGVGFAVRVLPLRLLYYVLNVISVGMALAPLEWRRRRDGKVLAAPTAAYPHGSR
jgi:GT2 family glycosyltransferase